MPPNIRSYTVVPALPERLQPLLRLAYNLWWSWHPEATALFHRFGRDQWVRHRQNPIKQLGSLPVNVLEQMAHDDSFLSHMDRVLERLDAYLSEQTWFARHFSAAGDMKIAYFSAEFGSASCLPVYSGGLGILAGDHVKSASDLGLPLVGVGLMYHEGYFHQYLNADGWQQEEYLNNDFYSMPITPIDDPETGGRLIVDVEYPGRTVKAQAWKIQVGRVSLYMLDTNIAANSEADRKITDRLYGGDVEHRVRQEVLLGIGGTRLLAKVGITPTVYHMNEGHSAFLAVERLAQLMQQRDLDYDTAREIVSASNVFTTHTPVPAGNDVFAPEMVDRYLQPHYAAMGLDREAFLDLGRKHAGDKKEPFCMTVLALRLAAHANGVSKLHGQVSRRMWKDLWPALPEDELPIRSITNGIHLQTWVSQDMAALFDRYLGPAWVDRSEDPAVWERVQDIPDAELWRTHERRRERLVAYARDRLSAQLKRHGAPRSVVAVADEVLDPEALTIGFARRFATYKRGTLILSDLERLKALLCDRDRPVQIIFAGKAHPRDKAGKELIQRITHIVNQEPFRHRIVFLENYHFNVARYLVQGVDVWLNTPRRPMEASGTSGMKVSPNGGINLSVLDGWWCEGYAPELGWAIGAGEDYVDHEYQDRVEGQALYDLLEREIVPMFYDRGRDDLPREWIERMKQSMAVVGRTFNTARMVTEYTNLFYLPADSYGRRLGQDKGQSGAELAKWRRRLDKCFGEVAVREVRANDDQALPAGDQLRVSATIQLGQLSPDEVQVQVYYGTLDHETEAIHNARTVIMKAADPGDNGEYTFEAEVPCTDSGRHGFAVRVLPYHKDLASTSHTGMIRWS